MAVVILLLFVLVPLIFGVPVLLGLVIYLLLRNKQSAQATTGSPRSNDKTLIKILIAFLILPIVLIFLLIFLVFFLGVTRQSAGFSTGYGVIPVTEYLETCEPRELVEDWFNTCSASSDFACYVLQYTPEPGAGEDYQYLIYIPEAAGYIDMDTDLEKKLFSHWVFQVDIQCADFTDEPLLFLVSYNGTEKPEEIEILYNGQKLDAKTTPIRQPLQ